MKARIMICLLVMSVFVFMGSAFAGLEGASNTFYGTGAGNSTSGDNDWDTFIGYRAGYSNTTGYRNTFLGYTAGYSNTTGIFNTFIGYETGYSNDNGGYNTFIGRGAGFSNISGTYNTSIGRSAGFSNTTGNSNVFLGYRAGFSETGSNKLYVDISNTTTPLIYGEFDNDILAIYGDLGLGMNNPSRVLDVYDAGDNARIAFHTDVTGEGIGNGSLIGPLQNGRFYLWNYENQDFWFGTNNLTRMIIKGNGYIGMGVSPAYPLHMASGARVTTGGAWQNASSRDYKENIKELTADKAAETLKSLNPVEFNYKVDKEESHVGFIAEDVPELVATRDRKGLSPMDIVAVLTKVVKEQQATLKEQRQEYQKAIQEQQKVISGIKEEMKELKKEMKLKGSMAMTETE